MASPTPTTSVPRVGRALDLVGLLFLVVGGGMVGRAWLGFRDVQAFQSAPGDPPMAAVQLADGFWMLQRIGVGLMLVGVAVFVLAWWVARRKSIDAPGG